MNINKLDSKHAPVAMEAQERIGRGIKTATWHLIEDVEAEGTLHELPMRDDSQADKPSSVEMITQVAS